MMRAAFHVPRFVSSLVIAVTVAALVAPVAAHQARPQQQQASGTTAQTTGIISGTVIDRTRVRIPGVTITVTSPVLTSARSTVTNESGDYRFPFLPPGTYGLHFQLRGFTDVRQEGIVLRPGITATVNVELRVQELWYVLYDEAIKHVQRREWAEAETKLLAAKSSGPAPGRRVLRYGGLRDDYFPDYYLGVVYQNTNRPKEALAAFQLARSQNVNTADKEFQQLDALTRTASAALAKAAETAPAPVLPDPKKEVPTAPTSVRVTPDPKKDVPTTTTSTPATSDPKKDVPVTTAPDPPKADVPAANPPAGVVQPPPKTDAGINTALKLRFDRLIATGRNQLAQRDLGAARATAEQARALKVDQAQVDTLLRDINSAAARETSASESTAMVQFYSGDYEGALRTLDSLDTARAYFYRACSLAALAMRSDPIDNARLSQARLQYAEVLKRRVNFQNDQRYISPRIMQGLIGQRGYD